MQDLSSMLKRGLKFIWSILKTVHTLVFGVLGLAIIIAIFAVGLGGDSVDVPEGGALVLNPTGVLVEQKRALSTSDLLRGEIGADETLVRDIVDAIEHAADDERIGSLVLELDGLTGGMLPTLQRIAKSIQAFKAAGKRVVASGTNYSQAALFLAANADEVMLNPQGTALAEGYAMYRNYYHTLLNEHDVTISLFKVGKYKSATEPFFRDSMSDEDKEARMAILDNWWDAYALDLETARGLEPGSLDRSIGEDLPKQLAAAGGDLAVMSLNTGMVDRLATDVEQRQSLIELAGEAPEDEGNNRAYKGIGFADYLSAIREAGDTGKNKVAVITAVGTIVDGQAKAGTIGSKSLGDLIRKAHSDDNVKAVVLRVDSGGGSKSASEIIRQELAALQADGIPVIASMGSIAASGGYWISASADEIWALPTTLTGSIGIFGLFPSVEKTLEKYGVHSDGVATTPLAGGASLERGVTPAYAQLIQAYIEAGYDEFLTLVATNRNMSVEAVDEIAQGRVWSGLAAHELGLVDHLGDLEAAIAAAATRADIEDYEIWHVQPETSMQQQLIQDLVAQADAEEISSNAFSDPLRHVTQRLRRDIELLNNFNDPLASYVICGDCPIESP